MEDMHTEALTKYLRQQGGVVASVTQSCPTFCNPMDCSLTGSSVRGVLRATKLEWFAISFSRESSSPRDWTQVSSVAGRFFTIWVTGKSKNKESSLGSEAGSPEKATTLGLKQWGVREKKYWYLLHCVLYPANQASPLSSGKKVNQNHDLSQCFDLGCQEIPSPKHVAQCSLPCCLQ